MQIPIGNPKRRFPRASIALDALVASANDAFKSVASYRVVNLSVGGVFLVGPPLLRLGERVRVQLVLPENGPISVEAIVVRTEIKSEDELGAALAFSKVSETSKDLLERVVTLAIAKARSVADSVVLVVDSDVSARALLETDLEALGYKVASAGFFLNALRWLQDAHVRVAISFVELHLKQAQGIEFLSFLAEEFPEIRRVAMSSPDHRPDLEAALAAGAAEFILLKPWDRESLHRILAEP